MASIDDIKKLREETMASMIECRDALREAGGDFEKSKEILRKKGALVARKKTERATSSGIIASYIHMDQRTGVLVELNCETDFVAKNEEFKKLGHELAMHIAAMNPRYARLEDIPQEPENEEEHALLNQPYIRDDTKTIQDLINEYIGRLGENIQVKRFVRYHV